MRTILIAGEYPIENNAFSMSSNNYLNLIEATEPVKQRRTFNFLSINIININDLKTKKSS